jgi:hypothetical protein
MNNYNLKTLKLITKFWILDLEKDYNINKNSTSINVSKFFWNTIFDVDFFQTLINKKYIPFKKNNLNKRELDDIKTEIDFIIKKLNFVKEKINFSENILPPWWNDLFFSYRIFSNILYYYNDYYKYENVEISLRYWLTFLLENNNIEDFVLNIEKLFKSTFISSFINDLLENYDIYNNNKILFKFELFWPNELILAWLISKLLKKNTSNIKVVIDFSLWNEQFDFSQWVKFIKKTENIFFQNFDYFIIRNDFWNWIKLLLDYLNGLINEKSLKNIVYYNKGVIFNDIKNNNNQNIFDEFLISAFNKDKTSIILWKKAYFWRFLPYKCYWSNCSFCAINSQNKFEFDNKYSYDFFIDKWVNFIEENNIFSINFKDEAIPPRVILKFAQKIIKKGIKLNYQFRTRFEKIYNYNNCKILYSSWARYCWIWLESAVDRVNEEIWNKWNIWINIWDKIKIIHNFDKAWISIHNYSIMWFPWETEKESIITYKFLKNNILLSNYFTCTPNIFWLMKWTNIFNERNKRWIEINNEELNNPFNLDYNFTINWKQRNLLLLNKLSRDLHFIQFLPWLETNKSLFDSKDFRDYIDRSYIFYLTKRYNVKNPFYLYKNANNSIFKKDFELLLKEKFNISNYIQIFEDDNNIYIYDWVMCVEVEISLLLKDFIKNYNNKISLYENFINNWVKNVWIFKEELFNLFKNNILLSNVK